MRSRQRRRCIDGIDGEKERGKRGGANNVATAAAATCLDFEMHLLSLTRTAEPFWAGSRRQKRKRKQKSMPVQ